MRPSSADGARNRRAPPSVEGGGALDADALKTMLRMIPYGLYMRTATHTGSTTAGTINWVSQMSFDPPLLALSVPSGAIEVSEQVALATAELHGGRLVRS